MKKKPFYQNFQVLAWIAGGITASGALIVGAATYINLPKTVEAVQQKNQLQDEAILELKKSNEIWQNIYQQQQPQGLREWDGTDEVFYCCDLNDREQCFSANQWYKCR